MIDEQLRRLLFKQLYIHEGCELKPYKDSKGYWTIGIGHLIDPRLTGDEYSFNHFMENGCSEEESRILFNSDLDKVIYQLDRRLPWWIHVDEVRRRVLIDLCFNLGIGGLLKFKNMLHALDDLDFDRAADELMYVNGRTKEKVSDWYNEVGKRAKRLVKWMRTGEINEMEFL